MDQLGNAMDLDFIQTVAPESDNINHTDSILGKRKVEEAIVDNDDSIESKVEHNKVDLSKYATAPTDLKARVKHMQYNFNDEVRRWSGKEWNCVHDRRQGRCEQCKAATEAKALAKHDKLDVSKYPLAPTDVKLRIKDAQYNFAGEVRRWRGVEWNCVHDRRQGRCEQCKERQATLALEITCPDPKQRIKGMQYMFKGELRRWNKKGFHCVHDKQPAQCFQCMKEKQQATVVSTVTNQSGTEDVTANANILVDLSRYAVAPTDPKLRVKGVQYNFDGELRRWEGYAWRCKHDIFKGLCLDCKEQKEPTLTLDITDAHLSSEWCEEENGPMSDYSRGSGKTVYFQCTNGHAKYQTRVATRVGAKIGCLECVYESQRKYDLDLIEEARIKSETMENSAEIGDETELYVYNLLKDVPSFKSVENIGATGDKTDTVITLLNDQMKSLQVKTIGRREVEINGKSKTEYRFNNNKIYPGDMLFAMVSRDRTLFAVEFYKNLSSSTIGFGYADSKYNKITYRNSTDFVNKIVELIPFSIQMTESVAANTKAEIDSLKRLEQVCTSMGLDYKGNTTNSNTIDGFINDRAIQAKFRTKRKEPSYLTCKVGFKKSAGTLNGSRPKQPYSADDPFEFVIVEVAGLGTDKEKYFSQFLVIPKQVLIDRKVLASATEKGKKSFEVCTPDYTADHWSKKYWNNFSPFVQQIVQ